MSLSAIENLRVKIKNVRQRRKRVFLLWQYSLIMTGAATFFLIFGWLEMSFHFSRQGLIFLFFLWILGLVSTIAWNIVMVRRWDSDRQRLAQYVEDRLPDLEQRLLTSIELDQGAHPQKSDSGFQPGHPASRSGVSAQLVTRLWEDALAHVQHRKIEDIASFRKAWPVLGTACVISFFWIIMLFTSVDFFHASARILWPWHPAGMEKSTAVLKVTPGDLRMQKGNDLTIVATVENFIPQQVDLHLQSNRMSWDSTPMRPEDGEQTFIYFLSSLQEDFSYFVDIGEKRSRQYEISVFEMPRLEKLTVDYDYPDYTGMPSSMGKTEGDVIAPRGTRITLYATFNKPLSRATLQFNDGTMVELTSMENSTPAVQPGNLSRRGSFTVDKDATYTIKVLDQENLENVNPQEYFVQAIPDTPPRLTLLHPGKDRKVTSLEEVFLRASASDDYGLNNFSLHYSIAGREERKVSLLTEPQQKLDLSIEGETLIYLEDLLVKPGDFVSYFLSAADNNGLDGSHEVFSDIYFLEVISTEEEFRRAAPGPRGGTMGAEGMQGSQQESSALAENQKKIIAATWKLWQRQKTAETNKIAEDTQVVTDSQSEVLQRARMSLRRLRERFSFSDESYDSAVIHMEEAVEQMQSSWEKLDARKLKEALVPQQIALQAILKADALSKRTRIETTRNRGQGEGSRQQQERDDLRELFEMEMGRLENRYEMPGQNSVAPQQAGLTGDILERLRELAQRQEQVHQRQNDLLRRQNQITGNEMKRHLEELRREQESLLRQTEELSRSASRFTQQGIGGRRTNRENTNRMQQLDLASRQMREAARSLMREEPETAARQSRQALEKLREQEETMQNMQNRDSMSNLLDALNRKAWQLREQEDQIQKDLQQALRENTEDSQEESLVSAEKGASTQDESQSFVQDVLSGKKELEKDIRETEKLLRTVLARGNEKHPQVASRALDALRTLQRERLIDRIEYSRFLLENGRLDESEIMEPDIAQSIEYLSTRFQQVAGRETLTREEQIRQAASDVGRLRDELENLRQQVENLLQRDATSGENRPPRSGQSDPEAELAQQEQSGNQGQRGQNQSMRVGNGELGRRGERDASISQMRENLQRAQYYARGLIEPWTRTESWAVDARSIQRELTRKEIEDFFTQRDLWKQLLEPIRELESHLQALVEIGQLKNRLYSVEEEEIPAIYENLVEEYYRTLSQPLEGRIKVSTQSIENRSGSR